MTNKKNSVKVITILTLVSIILATCVGGIFGALGADKEKYVVNKAKTEYKIVIAENAESIERNAAKELQDFFEEATGLQLPITSDEGLTAGGKYFSIGQNNLVTSQVKGELAGLKDQGYIIKTVGDTIYLIGPTAHGSLYSVYRYLKEEFNFEYYYTDYYSLDKGVGDVLLKDYAIKTNPDIGAMSTPSVGYIQNNSINRQRFTGISSAEYAIPANGSTDVHNLFRITPKELADTHPSWFSENLATGCFTARNNPAEYDALLEHYKSVAIKGMKISSAKIFIVSQPDNCGFCGCNGCNTISAQVGGSSGIMVRFCNDLARKLTAWFETEEGQPYKRDLKVVFLAYQSVASAPSASIKCDDNVGVYIAFDSYRSSYGLHENTWNESLYKTVMGWKEKTNIFIFWIYDVNFNWYFFPYDTSAYKQEFYKVMSEVGTMVVNDQNQTQNNNATAWGNVKAYISTKLRWDVDMDVEQATRDYFKFCYKDAWQTMYNVYCQYKAHWAYLKEMDAQDKKFDSGSDLKSIFGNLANTKFWSRNMVESWVAQFKLALEQIKPLEQTDKDSYDKAYKLISAELASPLYILLKLYRADYSAVQFAQLGEEFKYYVSVANIEYHADGMTSDMADCYAELGI